MTSYKKIEIRGKDLILSRYTGLDPADEFSVTFKTLDESSNYVIHRDILRHQLSQKQGTVSTKTRSEVRGGGKKPWRQKGTGRARAGSSRSPLWKGGGVIFGPKPKTTSLKVNKKERSLAIQTLLYKKTRNTVIVPNFETQTLRNLVAPDAYVGMTKKFKKWMQSHNIDFKQKILIIVSSNKKPLWIQKASQNFKNIELITVDNLNTLSLLKAKTVIYSELSYIQMKGIYNERNTKRNLR